MTDMIPLSLTVHGTTLNLRCPIEQAGPLKQAAVLLDQEMRSIKDAKMDVNPTRIAILAALKVLVAPNDNRPTIIPEETSSKVDEIIEQLDEVLA